VTQFYAAEMKGTMFIYYEIVDWVHKNPKEKMKLRKLHIT